MKKGKLLLSALAAAVFATGAGALVACSDVELPQGGKQPEVTTPPVTDTGKVCTVTFDANGGTLVGSSTLKTDKNGIVQGTVPTATKEDNTFKGWTLTQGSTTVINFTTQKFTSDKSVYAVYAPNQTQGPNNEYMITFYAGAHGTVSGQNEIKTSNKKISTFPAIIEEDGWKFDYWALTDDPDTHVDSSYTFTATTTVTAHYKEDENYDPNVDADTYYLVGSMTEWSVNTDDTYVFTQTEDADGYTQYMLTIELHQNDEIKISKGNATLIDTWQQEWSFAEQMTDGNLKIKEDGTYDIYLKLSDPTSIWVHKQGGGGGEEVTGAYVLGIGGEGHWDPADGEHPLTINPDNDYCTEYAAENVTVSAGEQIKLWLNGVYYAHLQEAPAVPEEVATGGGYTNDAGNITIVEDGTYNFYLKIYGEGNGTGSHDIWISKVGGGGNNDDEGSNFYLFGKIGGVNKWSISAGGIKFVETELNPYEDSQVEVKYKAEATLSVNDEVKIFKSNDGNAWNYSNFEEGSVGVNCELTSDGNIKIKRAGNYTVYLRMHKDGGTSVRVFYVAPQPAETATAKLNTMAMADESATRIPADADHDKLTKWYVLENVTLQANTKIKFYVNDQEVSGLFRVSSQLINGGVSGDNTMGVEFTMPKSGTFEFHLKYYIGEGWKVWIHGTLDDPTPPTPDTDPNASLTYGSATGKFAEDGYTGGYLVGKFTAKNHTVFGTEQWNNGYQMTFDNWNFKITAYLKAGDVVKVRVNVGDGSTGVGYSKLDDNNKTALNGKVSNDDDDNLVIGQDGYYTFAQWYSNNPDGGGMSVTYSATKPNGGEEGGGGGQGGGDTDSTFGECTGDGAWLVGVIQAKNQTWEPNGWGNGYIMERADETGGNRQYKLVVTLQAGDEVKIRYNHGADSDGIGYDQIENRESLSCIEDAGGNYKIKETGTYTFYFKFEWDSNKVYVVFGE